MFSEGKNPESRAEKSALEADPHLHPLPCRERRQKDSQKTSSISASAWLFAVDCSVSVSSPFRESFAQPGAQFFPSPCKGEDEGEGP
ncbi:MAG: hypothetical protein WCA22_20350, partial [Candidatus Binatus sp.]